jgi:hypothetical protein
MGETGPMNKSALLSDGELFATGIEEYDEGDRRIRSDSDAAPP